MTGSLRFHHLGLATRELSAETTQLEGLGYRPEGPPFIDQAQGVRGQFMIGAGPRIEVLTPTNGSRTLETWLLRGIKIYHQAFEVADLDAEVARHQKAGAIVVSSPMRAVAFSGRRVAFVMLPNLLLIEMIESQLGQSG